MSFYVLALNYYFAIGHTISEMQATFKVIVHKSRGEVSQVEQDTIEYVS